MANNKTLLTAIERKRKQIARLETEMLNMQNQIKMNHAINSCRSGNDDFRNVKDKAGF
ncbi:coil containing protein [Vibrio phage 1.137.O._10N.261.46.B5]|nr:coil containing protein [Vibrio phage 1.137.O._10N.261.46.B5]